ncbi:unnamed protein product [Boreogadus saida]
MGHQEETGARPSLTGGAQSRRLQPQEFPLAGPPGGGGGAESATPAQPAEASAGKCLVSRQTPGDGWSRRRRGPQCTCEEQGKITGAGRKHFPFTPETLDRRTHPQTDRGLDRQEDGRTHPQTDRGLDRQEDGRTHPQMDRGLDRQEDGRTHPQTDRGLDRQEDGRTHPQMDRGLDRQEDGQTGGRGDRGS